MASREVTYTCTGCKKKFESRRGRREDYRYCASCAGILRKAGLGPIQTKRSTQTEGTDIRELRKQALRAARERAGAKRPRPQSKGGDITLNVNMTDILTIHEVCLEAIGGDDSEAVRTYYAQKNTRLTRDEFYDRATWAILVAGIKRAIAEKLKERAGTCSFPFDWKLVADWNGAQFDRFINCIRRNRGGSAKKWSAIRAIALWLYELGSDREFQRAAFGGKSVGNELGEEDVVRLLNRRLPFVGPANSQYIVRMLGGEIIKDDVWVQAFRAWKGWSLDELNQEVDDTGIPRGFWDTVIWQYCETYVRETKNLPSHFNQKFVA